MRGRDNKEETLLNELKKPRTVEDRTGINLMLDMKQRDTSAGGSSGMKPPPREVLNNTPYATTKTCTDKTCPVYVTYDNTPKTEPESILT